MSVPVTNVTSLSFVLSSCRKNLKVRTESCKTDCKLLLMHFSSLGFPRLSSTGTLSVLLQDENDNTPEFEQKRYNFKVRENNEPGMFVGTFHAKDMDVGTNGEVRYSLEGEGAKAFSIHPINGELKASWPLDREERDEYIITVTAGDLGQDLQLTGSCLVTIRVGDDNDNAPIIANIPSILYVPDTTAADDLVFKLDGVDPDKGPNSALHFTIGGRGASHFSLDPSTGRMTARRNLVAGESHTLEVEVVDSGSMPLSTKGKLTVMVASSTLFPVFSSSARKITVKEGEKTTGKT